MAEDIVARYRLELDALRGDVSELKRQFSIADSAATSSAGKANEAFNKLGSNLKNIGAGILAAFSVQQVVRFGEEAIKAYQEAEKNARKLQVAVGVSGGLQADFEKLIALSEELQSKSIFSDDDIQKIQTAALQYGFTADEVQNLTGVVADFASGTGQDLQAALSAIILGTEGSERALKQYGIQVDSQATRSQNYASIVDQLNAKFKGQAEILANTSEGSIAKLRNSFDNLKESVGEALIPFAQAATDAASALIKMAEVPLSEKLQDEQDAFRASRIELLSLNVGSEERVKIIKELQSKYPEFLANINAETATNDQLRDALEKVNNQYIYKIALAQGKESIQPLLEDEAEASLAAAEAQTKLAAEIDKVIQQALRYPSAKNKQIAADLEYLPVLEQGRQLAEGRIKFDAIAVSSLQNLGDAYNDAKQTQIEYASASIKSTDAQKEFNKTVANLKNIFQINDQASKVPTKTGLEKLTQEEINRIEAAQKAAREAREKAEAEAAKQREELRKKELAADEENVKIEVANRISTLDTANITEKQMAIAVTQIELFQLMARLQNFKDYGEEVGDVMIQIANKNLELKAIMAKPGPEVHPNREDFEPIQKFYDDWKKLDENRKKEFYDMLSSMTQTLNATVSGFTEINIQNYEDAKATNDAQADAETKKIEEQFNQRIIGQAEYEKKLQAVKDRREGNENALNERIRKLKVRQALFDKAQTVFQIGLSTREAIMNIQAKWAAVPPVATALTIGTLLLAAGQLALALSANPPTAHTGEKYVTKKGKTHGFNLKSDETLRTLQVGERVFDKRKNKDHWDLFEAVENGKLNEYLHSRSISKMLISEKVNNENRKQRSLAENVAASFINLSSSGSDGMDERTFTKLWNNGIRISNIRELAQIFESSMNNPYRS